MTILVTGCSGFLGRAFMRMAHTEPVIGIDAVPFPDMLGRQRTTHVVDLLDADAVSNVIWNAEPSKILHLAADSSTGNRVGKIEHNVRMTWNVLRAARRRGRPHVVVAGSAAEYGDVIRPAQEHQVPDPIDDYGFSKAASSLMALAFDLDYDLPVCVLRFGNLYGPWQQKGFVPMAIRRLRNGETLILNGNGAAVRPWLYVADALAAIQIAFNAQGIFNVANGQHALKEVAAVIANELVCRAMARNEILTPQIKYSDESPGARVVAMDCSLFAERHNFRPTMPLHRGISLTVAPYFEAKS